MSIAQVSCLASTMTTNTRFSLSPSPSSSPFHLASISQLSPPSTPEQLERLGGCICHPSEIIVQLSNENEEARLQCLAYTRIGQSSHFRCQNSSQRIQTYGPKKSLIATEILSNDPTSAFEYSSVIRILFCKTHHDGKAFKRYQERIQAHWNENGNGKVKELRDAIRRAHCLPIPSPLAPAVSMPGTLPLRLRRSSGEGSATAVASPQPLPMSGYEATSTGTIEPDENPQNRPTLVSTSKPSIDRTSRTLFPPSVSTRHTRSRSSPHLGISHPRDTRGIGESQVAESSREVPAIAHVPSEGPARRESNPPLPIFAFGSPAPETTVPDHEGSAISTNEMHGLIPSSSAPRATFDFSYPPPNIELSISSAPESTPNDPILPAPTAISNTSDTTSTQRPSLNGQPQAASAPMILSSTRLTSSPTLSASRLSDPDAPRGVVPRMDTISTTAGTHTQTLFTPRSWENWVNWKGHLRPPSPHMTAREIRFHTQRIPQRSQDDTCVGQVARPLGDGTPAPFDANPEDQFFAAASANMVNEPFPPRVIDMKIREMIRRPVTKGGHVYILKAPEYFQKHLPQEKPLFKIGMTTDITQRIASIKRSCGISDLARVFDSGDVSLPLHWKVEELVHTELQNFRRPFACPKCKGNGSQAIMHTEWFAVTEEVALRTVQRWRNFILEEPYDENGDIKSFWGNKVYPLKMERATLEENWDDSEMRDGRWSRWLENGVNEINSA